MTTSSTSHLLPSSPPDRHHIPWRQIVWFIVLTFGLTWLITLPLYLVNDPATVQLLYLPISLVMMGIPGLIAWLIVRKNRPKGQRAAALGFTRPRPVPRFLGYLALAFLMPVGIGLLSLPLAVGLDLFEADFANLTGLQDTFAEAGVTGIPVEVLLIGQLINVVLASWFINLLPALGEEIGWRGWLTPQLLPLGVLPTIIITGLIWGLWHTPLMLLGHNYPQLPAWLAVVFMVIFCTLIGGVLAWLTIRTNSVWPAALGHSTINATAALPLLFSVDGTYDPTQVGIAGTTGWIITAILLAVFLLTKSFRAPLPPEVDAATAWPGDFPAHAPDAPHPGASDSKKP